MLKIGSIILLAFCIVTKIKFTNGYLHYIAARLPLEGTPSPPGSPWPLVQKRTSEPTLLSIGLKNSFKYETNVGNCTPLEIAFNSRYKYETLFEESLKVDENKTLLTSVIVNISENGQENECDLHPRLVEDLNEGYENYTLSVRDVNGTGVVLINSKTVWGALRALETFTHLIWESPLNSNFYINLTEISDWPRFPHRGLMIDSARHFLPVPTILQILDGMSYNKLNVLHWHIVDDQSFPFVSETYPELSEKGSYGPNIYTYDPPTVQKIIEEARVRGIRVILEFDTPGHTQGFGKAFKNLLTECYGEGPDKPGTPNYPNHAAYEILDPTKNFTYDFMKEFFTEIVKNVTKDEYIHLGMDEVYYKCWESSPVIKKFMEEKGLVNYSKVQEYYTTKHLSMVKELGAKRIVWNDPLDYNVTLDKDVIVQVWKKDENEDWGPYFKKALDGGYKVILSSCWYLNYIEYGQTWRKYYECDPLTHTPPGKEKQVLGGEAAIWGEYVDETNILPRFFPFVSAVAEKLWSNPAMTTVNKTNDAMWRLDEHRCRMLWCGIPAQPILNGYCDPKTPFKSEDESSTIKQQAFSQYLLLFIIILKMCLF